MMRPVPPGEVLQEQLEELNMSASKLAAHLDVPTNRITEILNGERALTADTALRLSKFFGTTPEFWMALQSNYELQKARTKAERPLAKVTPLWQLKSPATQREYILRRDTTTSEVLHVADRKRDVHEAPPSAAREAPLSPARAKKKAAAKKVDKKTPVKRAKKA